MHIRIATSNDFTFLAGHDKHIRETEMKSLLQQGHILLAEEDNQLVGWLRWGLFWDSMPFMNMLYFLEPYRGKGYGKVLVTFWETEMRQRGYQMVMTSSQSHECAQHFYRKLGYTDSGALLLKNDPLEIIFTKELL